MIYRKNILITLLIVLTFCFIKPTFAIWYNPTATEVVKLNKALYYLEKKFNNNNIKINQFVKLIKQTRLESNLNEKQIYFLTQIEKHFNPENVVINLEQNQINNFKSNFVNKYWNSILWDKNIDPKCVNKYYFVDNIAKNLNFPTELVLAIWKMETNCNMNNPKNWDWIFQIRSFYFKPWPISDKNLEEQINILVKLIDWKLKYYNKKYKKNINISYENYGIYDIQIIAWLYSWNYKKVSPEKSLFWNGNLSKKFISKKDWLVTNIIKVFNWYLENN